MEIKVLEREIMHNETLAERGRMILDLNRQVIEGKEQITTLSARVVELETELSALTVPVTE